MPFLIAALNQVVMANDCHKASHNLFATSEWRKRSGGDSHSHICATDANTLSTPLLSPVFLEGGEQEKILLSPVYLDGREQAQRNQQRPPLRYLLQLCPVASSRYSRVSSCWPLQQVCSTSKGFSKGVKGEGNWESLKLDPRKATEG